MSTVTIEVDIKQIERAIKRLKPEEKIKLVENLEKEAWPGRFKDLLERIDRKAAKYPISEQKIDQACEKIRHKPYVHHNSH